ncbi:hypothetical protein BT63DRAFT_423637 [Microthyrium microscopicum]|uniref:Uncharacterized protein n=1 Tax=Microthyrium microscopicum TaxID=703497 RepID=A0A6A6UGP0_9PEZI|nr:hypothetical protein BT63DRAFT_423637 [Microthyrium microscopicum]
MRPTPSQLTIAHPAWIDYVPWPEIRDHFIRWPSSIGHGDVQSFFASHTHINWPSTHGDMLCIDPTTESLALSDEFESWAKDINNWSLDSAVEEHYPTIATMAWVKINGQVDFQEDMQAFESLINDVWSPTLTATEKLTP